MTLTRGSERWLLHPLEEPGTYGYPDDDLQVRAGDLFRMEVEAFGRTATGETIVPGPPDGVQLDKDSLEVPELTPGSFQPGALQSLQVTVSWENPGSILHFVDVEGLNPEAESIFPDFIREGAGRFRIRSAPTDENFHAIGLRQLEHLGRHRAIVYRVNQEYADLYNNRVQDSRDLNEPPSNIRGAWACSAPSTRLRANSIWYGRGDRDPEAHHPFDAQLVLGHRPHVVPSKIGLGNGSNSSGGTTAPR